MTENDRDYWSMGNSSRRRARTIPRWSLDCRSYRPVLTLSNDLSTDFNKSYANYQTIRTVFFFDMGVPKKIISDNEPPVHLVGVRTVL